MNGSSPIPPSLKVKEQESLVMISREGRRLKWTKKAVEMWTSLRRGKSQRKRFLR